MKALSIIGIIFSVFGIMVSMALTIMNPRDANGLLHEEFGPIFLAISIYFLMFSVIGVVLAFRKTNT